MTHDDVQRWLDRYVAAWQTYDEAEIRDLFAEDAEYRYHPYDEEPVSGREAIVADWLDSRDEPGTWIAMYGPWAVDGDRAVATGETIYYDTIERTKETRRFWNSWLLTFDGEGRCREFVEYYMQRRD